jgi:UDPglucose 6-dehydrogenase
MSPAGAGALRVAVLGAGRVGLVTGLALWELGHDVVLVDLDAARVERLERGQAPFFEPGVGELLARAVGAGRLAARGDVTEALGCDVALICVPTPSDEAGAVDTRHLHRATGELAAAIAARGGDVRLRTVFVRSTAVPGTTRSIVVERLGGMVDIGYLPEFLREGTALADARVPDRVVVGADEPRVYAVARGLWGGEAPVIETSIETAELTKYANNALLALCVSFSNELARIAERLPGVDARDALEAVVRDRRLSIGAQRAGLSAYLEPGPGFGGSCLRKDVRALSSLARALGEPAALLDGIIAVNDAQPLRLVDRVDRALDGLAGRSVLVLGLAFKIDTDDVRDSIAFPVIAGLEARGAHVACHDPAAAQAFLAGRPAGSRAALVDDWRAAAGAADALVLLTPWPAYVAALPGLLAGRERPLLLADGRGALRGAALPGCVRYLGVGRAMEMEVRDG